MNVIDLVVIFFAGIFLVIDGLRGFIKSVGALVAFILGFWIAGRFAYIGTNYLKTWLHPILSYIISFLFIFILVFICCRLFSYILKSILRERMIRGFDHFLGMCLGIAKGFFLATIIFMLLNLFHPIPQRWKKRSFTYPYLYRLSQLIINYVPQKMMLTKPKRTHYGRVI
ncbi:MAG TPA: CvpA family protein [Candidatus Desulfofervidus auxilii]|uniref:CvpA family protein n=1 Tax=Desulfofervidus auxilii TaxID=1621989 RepID=A0A7V0IA18_DESA2|nr:CvpA family protein [Candidatus Desulfofervidus auxilii]